MADAIPAGVNPEDRKPAPKKADPKPEPKKAASRKLATGTVREDF